MAFGFYMNMEKLALNISEKHISEMTNDNMFDDISLDKYKIMNNIMNGFVVITQLSVFFESFLNTILDKCMLYNEDVLFRCNTKEKLDIIFMYYRKDWSKIKDKHPWEMYRTVTKVRNAMIHFKKTDIGEGSEIPNFEIAKKSIKDFFTKKEMNIAMQQIIELTNLIAKELGLEIHSDVDVFECDGMDELVNYVYDKSLVYIDDSRLND